MKYLSLFSYILWSTFSFASQVKVDLVKIKLSPTDSFGLFKINGDLKLNVDSQSFDIDFVNSEFKFKALGFGLGETFKETFDVQFNKTIDLIRGSAIALPGFNTKKVLASLLVNKPSKIPSNDVTEYKFNVNHLLGFGQDASAACQQTESLNFKLIQNKLNFKLEYPLHKQPVTEIRLFIEALGKEKKLAHVEIVSSDRTSIVKYKNCKKIVN